MPRILAALVLLAAMTAHAEETVIVCYNYGCSTQAEVVFSDAQLQEVHGLLNGTADSEAERAAIAVAVGQMYRYAGMQTPIWRDKAGDFNDDAADGSMDCIDHSTNTDSWLRLFARHGWLKYHSVLRPVRRGIIFTHFAARIAETAEMKKRQFAVDSWFYDHGHPAVVFTLEEWRAGARANGIFW
jgi:hypothetical protein